MSSEVLVLAAGRGSRLGDRSESVPKWLLEVGPVTIAERQLEAIEHAAGRGAEIDSVRVVTGHAADAVERFLVGREGIEVATSFNPDYARLNNWYSVLLGLRAADPGIDRVVIVNADLFAPAEWLAAFIADAATTPQESLIGIDLERELTDESMKVALRRAEGGEAVAAIGKGAVTPAAGEYVGLLMAGGAVLERFRTALEGFVGDASAADAWYEQAVGVTAAKGTDWLAWPTPGTGWVEIDDAADLRAAVALEAGR
jgi:choline kinase